MTCLCCSSTARIVFVFYICYRLYAHKICPHIVSDHMRNFSNKKLARIDAYRARIVSAILRIVSDFSRTVRPKLADIKFHRSFVTMTPFSCVIMVKFLFLSKLFANGDRHLRTDIRHSRIGIQLELPHYSNRDLYLLTVCASI